MKTVKVKVVIGGEKLKRRLTKVNWLRLLRSLRKLEQKISWLNVMICMRFWEGFS